ncbi:MAG: GFA family protein [Rhodospirillales bacterium]|nr:GFA family protein [Rhodospirillales bacterium]MDH3792089.1 GFA family protein [Rhodospirillales bacterium]MDH3912916.1 GFA family protein [Rhodospirillales bacterium]MDH3920287.1 GFA family protein [Rhodospirillales bacterium]MDH3968799.1 GFA family protein [Rhodospirillales bacterium]
MTTPYTGGCRCGAVRYECSAEPMFPGNCYCRQCQKASGSGHVSAFAVPEEALTITGEVKYFDHPADNGNTASNGFCPTCGAPVLGKSSGMPGLMVIKAASLDDPSWFKPGMNIFTESAQPWDPMDPDLPAFEGMPEL